MVSLTKKDLIYQVIDKQCKNQWTCVTIFGFKTCPFCQKTQKWMNDHGIPFHFIEILEDNPLRSDLLRITKKSTVPQIFGPIGIDWGNTTAPFHYIGGYDDLLRLRIPETLWFVEYKIYNEVLASSHHRGPHHPQVDLVILGSDSCSRTQYARLQLSKLIRHGTCLYIPIQDTMRAGLSAIPKLYSNVKAPEMLPIFFRRTSGGGSWFQYSGGLEETEITAGGERVTSSIVHV